MPAASPTKPYTGDWFDKRNEKRRDKYHSDADYRSTANKQARDGYRETKGVKQPFDPRVNLDRLAEFGTVRLLEHGDAEVLTFTKGEFAAVFQRPVKQIQQWASDRRIPSPVSRAKVVGKERNWIDVYYLDEVTAMVTALGPLLAEMVYFRCDHVDAIRAVHDAVEKVRAK